MHCHRPFLSLVRCWLSQSVLCVVLLLITVLAHCQDSLLTDLRSERPVSLKQDTEDRSVVVDIAVLVVVVQFQV